MNRTVKTLFFFLISVVVLSGCGTSSFKEESKKTENAVQKAFKEKQKKPNQKTASFKFYLPFGYEIEEESPNNLILKNGSKTYILFNNPQESSDSKVVYNVSVAQHKKLDKEATYERNGKFAYLLIEKLKENKSEITIGIGGTKITTEVKTSSMAREATTMMQIVNSVTTNK